MASGDFLYGYGRGVCFAQFGDSFDELLEMTAVGCPKPAMRSVEVARNYRVPLHVRSAFTWEPGTWVVEEDPNMEQAVVSAVVPDTSEAKVTVCGVPDEPGTN